MRNRDGSTLSQRGLRSNFDELGVYRLVLAPQDFTATNGGDATMTRRFQFAGMQTIRVRSDFAVRVRFGGEIMGIRGTELQIIHPGVTVRRHAKELSIQIVPHPGLEPLADTLGIYTNPGVCIIEATLGDQIELEPWEIDQLPHRSTPPTTVAAIGAGAAGPTTFNLPLTWFDYTAVSLKPSVIWLKSLSYSRESGAGTGALSAAPITEIVIRKADVPVNDLSTILIVNSSLAADTIVLNRVKVPLRAILKSYVAEAFQIECVVRHATDAAATNLRMSLEYAFLG